MAGISTSLQVQDRLSPAFAAMTQSINICLASFQQMQAATGQAVDTAAIHEAQLAMHQVSHAAAGLDDELREAASGQDRYNQSVRQGESHVGSLFHKVKAFVGAYATIGAVKGMGSISDEMTQTTARLNLMNDNLQTTQELTNMVFAAANDARGSYTDMAAVVARFGNNAKDAFSSSAEVVDFAGLIQKQMTIAGASTNEAANAMIQLSQGLGSGVLRGEELNSVFDQAPNIIQNIADYLNVPIGEIRNMASEGNLTADVVKQAMFAATDDINEKFASMPMTWGQIGTQMQNTAIQVFQPVLNQINQIANSGNAQVVFNSIAEGMASTAAVAGAVFGYLVDGAGWVIENWDMIRPVFWGIATALGIVGAAHVVTAVMTGFHAIAAGTLAIAQMAYGIAMRDAAIFQMGLNAAMGAFPGIWVAAIIIGIIVAIAAFVAHMNGAEVTAMGVFGNICGGINVVLQFFTNLGLGIANIAMGIWAVINASAANIGTAFSNSILSVQQLFYNLAAVAIGCIADIGDELSRLPFIEFDTSGLHAAADDYKAKAAEKAAAKGTYEDVGVAYQNASNTYDAFQSGWVQDAFKEGQNWAKNKTKKKEDEKGDDIPNPYTGTTGGMGAVQPAATQTAGNTGQTAENTAAIANSVDISNEQLKYLKDIAERDVINRYTTASIKVDMNNNNTISSDMDLGGIVSSLTSMVDEAMSQAAEGVHK